MPLNSHPPLLRTSRFAAAAAAALALAAGSAQAVTKVYTSNLDFAQGILENLTFSAVSGQLQVSAIGAGSKFIFVANHNESTVSKFDTELNREVARYRTYTAGITGSPSRIAIDVDGNAYVLNREPDSGLSPQLLKILVDGAVDRNGNGVVDTSIDTNGDGIIQPGEMMAFTANAGPNNSTPAVFSDERIAWVKRIGTNTSLGRSICIAPDGKLWVGVWNQSRYYRVDPADGSTLPIPGTGAAFIQLSGGWNPYGCTIDKNGILWSATLSAVLGRVDTNAGTFTQFTNPQFSSTYGIAQGTNTIFQANSSGRTFHSFNTATNTFAYPATAQFASYGIAIDGEGNVLSSNSSGGVAKHTPAGALLWQRGAQPGTSFPLGVMIDGKNDVWVMNISSNNMSKYRGTDGTPLGQFPIGQFPYVYTDGSGLTTKNTTNNKQGSWTVVFDSGIADTKWGKINWTDLVPAGAQVEVLLRTAATQAGLELLPFVATAKNAALPNRGRFIQMRARLVSNPANETPQLLDLTVASAETSCDVNGDSRIDVADLNLIRAGIGQTPAAGDVRDANGDGKITVQDVRACTLKCTSAQCAQ
jgi:sugar lactone lactonase YvrE